MDRKPQTNQGDARITVLMSNELRTAIVDHKRSLENKTGLRTSLSAAAASLLRKGMGQVKN